MALIDRGYVMTFYLEKLGQRDSYRAKYEALADAVDEAPVVVAAQIVHAQWWYRAYRGIRRVTVSGVVVCSNCRAPFFRVEGVKFTFCPHCGAIMDGGGPRP